MLRLIVTRIFEAVVSLLLLSMIVFAVSRLTGDPLSVLVNPGITREDFERLHEALGLDRPLFVQYGIFLLNAIQGDLGTSYLSREPVVQLLSQHLAASAFLAGTAMALAWAVGIPLGVVAAQHQGTPVDSAIKLTALLGMTMPAFWLGLVLIEIFAVRLGWLPSGTDQGATSVILPAVTLVVFGMAGISRLLRSSMLDLLDSEFVKLARAKGVREVVVVWKHALKNAMFPVVSFAGIYLANLLTLSLVVEVVFSWPGLGLLTHNAILARDFAVVQGVVLLGGALVIFINLGVDILYAYLDPRVRYSL